MGLRRKTLASALSLALRLSNSSQAASACGARPAHSDTCALRSSHTTSCGCRMSAASATTSAAPRSAAAPKVSQASCRRSMGRALASATAPSLSSTTWRRCTAASRGWAAASASSASHQCNSSPGGRGVVSRTAACHAASGWPPASKARTPWRSKVSRASRCAVFRRAAKYRSADVRNCPSASARPAPRDRSAMPAFGIVSRRCSNWPGMARACTTAASACVLAPSTACSAWADWMAANTCAGVVTLATRCCSRLTSSPAAWVASPARPRAWASRSVACHQLRSHASQPACACALLRASGCASSSTWRAAARSPPDSSFSASSRRRLMSSGSVRMMLRR